MLKNGDKPSTVHLRLLESELDAVLEELKPLLDESLAQNDLEDHNLEEARALFDRLGVMLENINPECVDMLDEIRLIPGTKELVEQIEDYDFEAAAQTLGRIQEKLGGSKE